MYNIEEIQHTSSSLSLLLQKIRQTLPYDIEDEITGYDAFSEQKRTILKHYIELEKLTEKDDTYIKRNIAETVELLNEIAEQTFQFDLQKALEIIDFSLSWSIEFATSWYLKGRILYHLFTKKKIQNLEELLESFKRAIELSEDKEELKEITFWSYVLQGNTHLYLILSDSEAVNHALKYYNVAYRFAITHDIEKGQKLIFKNVELLQQVAIDKAPLLVLIYNQSGYKIFEYLFELIEVIAEDKWMIPNFTALLSAVDDRIKELFKANISNGLFVIQNRLMIISTLYDEDEDWVKVAMVFSYLTELDDDLLIDEALLDKVYEFNKALQSDKQSMDYIINFYGKVNADKVELIQNYLEGVFSIGESSNQT